MVEISKVQFTGTEGNILAASRYQPESYNGRPAVMLLHGGGQTRHSWHNAANALANLGHLTFTIDARGHGDSDWVESENYSFHFYRDDLRNVILQISAETGQAPISVGASMGGISTLLAQADIDDSEHQPSTLSAIVLVDITPRMESSGVDKILGFMAAKMRDGFGSVEEAADAIAGYLPDRARPKSLNGLSKNLRQREDGRWYWHWDPAFVDGKCSITTGGGDTEAMLKRAASQINVPTLLVRGGKSELVTKEAAEDFLQLVPHAKFVDVSEAGHMVAGDKNDVFASAVIEFLDSEFAN